MKIILSLFILLFLSVLLYAQDTTWFFKDGVLYEAVPKMRKVPHGKSEDKILALYKNATQFSDTERVFSVKPFPIGYFVVERFTKVTTYAKGVDKSGVYVSSSVRTVAVKKFYPNFTYLLVFIVLGCCLVYVRKTKESMDTASMLLHVVIIPGVFGFSTFLFWLHAVNNQMNIPLYLAPNALFSVAMFYTFLKKIKNKKD